MVSDVSVEENFLPNPGFEPTTYLSKYLTTHARYQLSYQRFSSFGYQNGIWELYNYYSLNRTYHWHIKMFNWLQSEREVCTEIFSINIKHNALFLLIEIWLKLQHLYQYCVQSFRKILSLNYSFVKFMTYVVGWNIFPLKQLHNLFF